MRLRLVVPGRRRARGLGRLTASASAASALETIATVSSRHRSEFEWLVHRLRGLGTDNVWIFGGDYRFEGGLRLQQRTAELAALLLYLRERRPRGVYLEIGAASGGTTRLIHEYLRPERMLSIDDGQHPNFHLQETNLVGIPNLLRHVGDSRADGAREFIRANLTSPLAVALIDGDHSYTGVLSDSRLALSFARPGTLLVFHDTVAVAEVARNWEEALAAGTFVAVAHFFEDGPAALGIGVGEVR